MSSYFCCQTRDGANFNPTAPFCFVSRSEKCWDVCARFDDSAMKIFAIDFRSNRLWTTTAGRWVRSKMVQRSVRLRNEKTEGFATICRSGGPK